MTQRADALLGRRAEGRVDKELASSLLGLRPSRGQFRQRPASGERPERMRGKEPCAGLLESCNGVELRGRRFDGVLVVVVNRSERLLLHRGRASVVVQNRVERWCVPGRRNAAKHCDVRRARIIGQRDPRWQWDGDADRCVLLDPRRPSIVVERVKVNNALLGSPLLMIR